MIIPPMVSRWMSLLVWAAVAASGAFWASRLLVQPVPAPAHAVTVNTSAAMRGDPTRVFGREAPAVSPQAAAAPVPVAMDGRFKLVGVVAARQSARGSIALIAVDGKPARAFRVGTPVEGDTVLQGVDSKGAQLGPRGGAVLMALALPGLPGPSTGALPPASSGAPSLPAAPGSPPVMPSVSPQPAPMPAPPGVVMAPGAPSGSPLLPGQLPSGVILPPQAPSEDGEPGPTGGRPVSATR